MKENEEDYQKQQQQQKNKKKNVEVNGHSGEIWRNAVDVNKASYRTLTWRFYKIFIQVINGLLV